MLTFVVLFNFFLCGVILTLQPGHEFDMLAWVKFFYLFCLIWFFSIRPSIFDLLIIELLIFYIFIRISHFHSIFTLLLNEIFEIFLRIFRGFFLIILTNIYFFISHCNFFFYCIGFVLYNHVIKITNFSQRSTNNIN